MRVSQAAILDVMAPPKRLPWDELQQAMTCYLLDRASETVTHLQAINYFEDEVPSRLLACLDHLGEAGIAVKVTGGWSARAEVNCHGQG